MMTRILIVMMILTMMMMTMMMMTMTMTITPTVLMIHIVAFSDRREQLLHSEPGKMHFSFSIQGTAVHSVHNGGF